jgi:hypothetical protein
MSVYSDMVWPLMLDLSLEAESLMLEMSRLEDMDTGINMENGEETLLGIHGLDTVGGKLLARRTVGVDTVPSLSELFVLYAAVTLR